MSLEITLGTVQFFSDVRLVSGMGLIPQRKLYVKPEE
jgi:hypothetical protein